MDACAAIYRRFGTACFNLALRILGERAAAEDVVQEVFLKMMNTLPGFRGDAPFGVWLKRMTANATIDALRASQRFADEDPEALFASMASRAAEADARVDAWSLLMRLPPRARAVLVLHELEGYTHKELSESVRTERELFEIDPGARAEEARRHRRTRQGPKEDSQHARATFERRHDCTRCSRSCRYSRRMRTSGRASRPRTRARRRCAAMRVRAGIAGRALRPRRR